MTLNADDRASLARAAADLIRVGQSVEQTVDRLAWSPIVKPAERAEVETYLRELLAVLPPRV